jgi:hypothetical protein
VKQLVEINTTIHACEMQVSLLALLVTKSDKKRAREAYSKLCNYYQLVEIEILSEKNISSERLNYLKSMKLLLRECIVGFEKSDLIRKNGLI